MVEPLSIRYQDLVRNFESISHLIDNKSKRSAWIGAGGSILKTIFGTLDEDDAMKYDSVLNSVQSNEKKLASLVKQNILLTSSTLSRYNETIYKIRLNEDLLNSAINEISGNLKNIVFLSNELMIKSKLDSILNRLETSILTISFQLEDITNAVLLSSRNIIHPLVITPKQLYRELADNHLKLSSGVNLPVSLELNKMYIILSMSKVICYYYMNKIMFVLKLPLVTPDEYFIYHNVPLPIPHESAKQNIYSVIIPNSKYLAMTKDKTRYCTLSDLNKCELAEHDNYVCDVHSVFSTNEYPSCESELITRVITSLPKQCDTKTIYGHVNIWNSMRQNKWIYVQSEPTKLSIECEGAEIYNVNIIGTGILTLPTYCIGFSNNIKLVPKFVYANISLSSVNADFNLLNDSCCNTFVIKNLLASNVSQTKLENIKLDDINSNEKIRKSLLDNADQIINEKSYFENYGTHYALSISSFILILIIIFVTIRLYKYVKPGSRVSFTRGNTDIQMSRRASLSLSENVTTITSPRLREIV